MRRAGRRRGEAASARKAVCIALAVACGLSSGSARLDFGERLQMSIGKISCNVIKRAKQLEAHQPLSFETTHSVCIENLMAIAHSHHIRAQRVMCKQFTLTSVFHENLRTAQTRPNVRCLF